MSCPINKTLDLVLTRVPATRTVRRRHSFADLVSTYGIALDDEDRQALDALPRIDAESRKDDISEIAVALEAKACMTEHVKSIPRLHAEILATGYLAKKASPRCISVCYSLVNAAPTFRTPSGKGKINRHNQPETARRVVSMLSTAVPLAVNVKEFGYDVVGVSVIDCRTTALR